MNSVEKRIGDIFIKVDYRTELMGVITWLGKYHKEMPELYSREGNKEYIKEIRKEFKPYAKDEVIKEFDKLVKEFDLYNEDSFEMFLELDNELNPTDETNEQRINDFSLKLKDFSEKIGFDNFFEEHRNEYETYVENISKIFETVDVSKFMFEYFGYKLNKRINVILMPFAYGETITNINDFEINLLIPVEEKSFTYEKGKEYFVLESIVYEMSKELINTISKSKQVTIDSNMFDEIKGIMEKYDLLTNEDILNEHIVKSIENRFISIALNNEGFADGRRTLNITSGFIYLDYIIDLLKQYEKTKEIYSSFDAYYPLLVERLKENIKSKEIDE